MTKNKVNSPEFVYNGSRLSLKHQYGKRDKHCLLTSILSYSMSLVIKNPVFRHLEGISQTSLCLIKKINHSYFTATGANSYDVDHSRYCRANQE